MTKAAKTPPPPKPQPGPMIDPRVDRIGWAKELVKNYLEPLVKAFKEGRVDGEVIEGNEFTATMQPCMERSISAESLLKLYEARKISRAQFIKCMGPVKVAETEKVLDSRTFGRVCLEAMGNASLIVKRHEGLPRASLARTASRLLSAVVADEAPATERVKSPR